MIESFRPKISGSALNQWLLLLIRVLIPYTAQVFQQQINQNKMVKTDLSRRGRSRRSWWRPKGLNSPLTPDYMHSIMSNQPFRFFLCRVTAHDVISFFRSAGASATLQQSIGTRHLDLEPSSRRHYHCRRGGCRRQEQGRGLCSSSPSPRPRHPATRTTHEL